jgi:hypothetical protein
MSTMSAADIVTIISAVTISLTTILGTVATLYTTIRVKSLSGSNQRMEQQNARLEASAEIQAANIQKIELATNSMKDELILATGKASRAEGHAAGIAEAQNRAKGNV